MIVRAACLVIAVLACAGCASRGDVTTPPVAEVGEDLTVRTLDEGIWLHTTWVDYRGTPFPSHGLLVRRGDALVMIDTAWGDEPTRRLIALAEREIGLPVTLLIATHAHSDRLGGAQAVRDAGGEVFLGAFSMGGEATRWRSSDPELLRKGMVLSVPGRKVEVGGLEVFYPGPAHTNDNLMVWLPDRRVLFGGCAVQPLERGTLGNVRDADVDAWAPSVERAIERYGDARLVVPSHGEPGGLELLRHTVEVAKAAAAQAQ